MVEVVSPTESKKHFEFTYRLFLFGITQRPTAPRSIIAMRFACATQTYICHRSSALHLKVDSVGKWTGSVAAAYLFYATNKTHNSSVKCALLGERDWCDNLHWCPHDAKTRSAISWLILLIGKKLASTLLPIELAERKTDKSIASCETCDLCYAPSLLTDNSHLPSKSSTAVYDHLLYFILFYKLKFIW